MFLSISLIHHIVSCCVGSTVSETSCCVGSTVPKLPSASCPSSQARQSSRKSNVEASELSSSNTPSCTFVRKFWWFGTGLLQLMLLLVLELAIFTKFLLKQSLSACLALASQVPVPKLPSASCPSSQARQSSRKSNVEASGLSSSNTRRFTFALKAKRLFESAKGCDDG